MFRFRTNIARLANRFSATLTSARVLAPILALAVAQAKAAEPAAPAQPVAEAQAAAPRFDENVLPILTQHCLKCHGLEARQANLDLRTVGLIRKGGESGPAIDAAALEKSLLLERIADRSMPPKKELPLDDQKLSILRRWITAGAPGEKPDADVEASSASTIAPDARQFWAFQRLKRPTPPAHSPTNGVRAPIDAFLLARLAERGLSYSPEVDRRRWIRRVYLDLIGLLPAPAEVDKFVADTSPDAHERLVDGLLASPHFGERWGRHWLDWAGYVDVIGDDTDREITKISAGKWRYRDWVVRKLNEDAPLDRVIIEQLAGDELLDWRRASEFSAQDQDLLVATGFLRTAPDETLQNELNTADIRHQVLAQSMEVAINNLLGLTIQCARCHTHKFDPIPQEDYYRLMAFFSPAYNPEAWLQPADRELADIPPAKKAEYVKANAELDRQVAAVKTQIEKLREPRAERLRDAKLATLPEAIRADTKAAIAAPADKRSEVQKYLLEKFGATLKVSPEEIDVVLSAEERQRSAELSKQIVDLNAQKKTWNAIQAVYDTGPPSPTYLLRRGNHQTPGPEVPPAFLRVLCETDDALAKCEPPFEGASGRRLALAKWLTARDTRANALMSRVLTNRVWQELLGRGIVATSDNLGQSGARPTHPELLEWLASDLVDSGWRLKPLVRSIVLSAVYRQESAERRSDASTNAALSSAAIKADPANELWWRMPLRQVDSEILRDAILSASGKLDRAFGGPSLALDNRPNGAVVVKTEGLSSPSSQYRRSLYLTSRRRYNLSLLEIFDQPEMARNCSRRTPSAVVTQSLALMHDGFLQEQALWFADRVRVEAPLDATTASQQRQIAAVFRIALAREPDDAETQAASELIRRQTERYAQASMSPDGAARKALAHLCQMVLASNEFLYTP